MKQNSCKKNGLANGNFVMEKSQIITKIYKRIQSNTKIYSIPSMTNPYEKFFKSRYLLTNRQNQNTVSTKKQWLKKPADDVACNCCTQKSIYTSQTWHPSSLSSREWSAGIYPDTPCLHRLKDNNQLLYTTMLQVHNDNDNAST